MNIGWGGDYVHSNGVWKARAADHSAEIRSIWSACGADTEWAKIRKVLLHVPDPNVKVTADPSELDWYEPMDLGKVGCQISALGALYQDLGIEVQYLQTDTFLPNQIYMRDVQTMTSEGAIISRMASSTRSGEEREMSRVLAELGVPIVRTVTGTGTFEGPDLMHFAPGRAFVATSIRSNPEGARQVSEILASQGIDVVAIQTTYGCGHLDGVLALLDRDLALVHPKRLSYTAYSVLIESGFSVLSLPNQKEAELGMAINYVTVSPREVVGTKNNPVTNSFLRSHGIKVHEIAFDEVMKGGGSVHCCTAVIQRDLLAQGM